MPGSSWQCRCAEKIAAALVLVALHLGSIQNSADNKHVQTVLCTGYSSTYMDYIYIYIHMCVYIHIYIYSNISSFSSSVRSHYFPVSQGRLKAARGGTSDMGNNASMLQWDDWSNDVAVVWCSRQRVRLSRESGKKPCFQACVDCVPPWEADSCWMLLIAQWDLDQWQRGMTSAMPRWQEIRSKRSSDATSTTSAWSRLIRWGQPCRDGELKRGVG